ncbi:MULTISPECIES: LacI family DNA-binding transcriptional regulator [unclassified Pseudonocardia]|uniref:LacI family DNA-binding transcriptional regulator n=1 Tax=unclassified Pseudonocardia TaxID=2619320 RepID=UPI0020166EB8|nr:MULTISPECIES: LacI family DNA-binding transcriptional regulator [unclassified Pseudonocardia]
MADGRRRVTIADIAARAGVSKAAVSYALNGVPGVSPAVRQQILDIAAELRFRPNRIAQDLRAGTAKVIGILLDNIENPVYTEIAGAAVSAAAERGYEVFVSHLGTASDRKTEVALSHVDRNISGLILTSVTVEDIPLLASLRERGVACVQAYRGLTEVPNDWVGIDDRAAARELAAQVLAGGRRSVAILSGVRESVVARNRVAGFREALAERGIEPVNPDDVWGPLTREAGVTRARDVLDRHPGTDLLLCASDVIAVGAWDHAREAGLSVPGDLAITGFDGTGIASAGPLQLSTVNAPRRVMGECAATMLIDRIEGADGPPIRRMLPYETVLRDSTGEGGAPAARPARAGRAAT